jgi:predicted acylesterase/phospholipase RssA
MKWTSETTRALVNGPLTHPSPFRTIGALFDAQVLKAALKDNIGDVTFQEAYNRTRRILNITVSTSANFEMPRLLNYLTAPNVLIWSAVYVTRKLDILVMLLLLWFGQCTYSNDCYVQ